MLNIEAHWAEAIELVRPSAGGLIYDSSKKTQIPDVSGAYIFARQHGNNVVPMYIGEAQNIRKRFDQHLKNSVLLMNALRRAGNGKRIFIWCVPQPKKKQNQKKARTILQDALIENALAEGHQLVNKHGTKVPVHTIDFKGNRVSEKLAPRQMCYR
jgi:hypothetical protein